MSGFEKQRDWREWERIWRADPDNQAALQQSILALRRAGKPVPKRMLERQYEPRKQFQLPFQATFGVLPRAGHLHYVEGRKSHGSSYQFSLPPRKRWWLHLESESLEGFLKHSDALRAVAVPEIVFEQVQLTPDFLGSLDSFPSVHSLQFDHCQGLKAQKRDPFQAFPNLRNLQFYQCSLPEGPIEFSLGKLEQLTFNDCPNLTGDLFSQFLKSDRIEKIELKKQDRLEEKGLNLLSEVKALKSLTYVSNEGQPGALEQFAALSGLEELILHEAKSLTEEGLVALAPLRQLRKLDFSSSYFMNDAHLRALSRLESLEEIQFTHNDTFTSEGVGQLAKLPRLAALKLVHCRGFDGQGLKAFEGSDSLKRLDLSACTQLTVDDFTQLSLPKTLERLVLYGCYGVSNPVLKSFEGLTQLRKLNLHSCRRITNKGLSYLKDLAELTHLEVSNSGRISDAVMKHLLRFKKLKQLGLSSCPRISDRGVEQLSALKNLRSLDLGACPNVTDLSLRTLAELKSLETLIVNYCGVDGSGLAALKEAKSLSWLCMVGCSQISIEDLRALKKALPDCHMTVPMTLFAQWGSP